MFDVPILINIYNREDLTLEMYKILEKIKPKHLYINADGPKLNNKHDDIRCNNTRNIFLNLNWDCEIKYNFSTYNKGCKLSVSDAITWFFDNVEYGIILEDDCIPNISFFSFCKILLEKYRYNEEIYHINGSNFLGNIDPFYTESYFFTKHISIWGWATWKRAWDKYDLNFINLNSFNYNIFNEKSFSLYAKYHYTKAFFDSANNIHNTWCTAWIYTVYYNNGISITPKFNLVSNIGTQNSPTHNFLYNRFRDNIKTVNLFFPLIHPKFSINHKIDRLNFKNYRGKNLRKLYYFIKDNNIIIITKYIINIIKNRKFY
jgi:hypothetical protein